MSTKITDIDTLKEFCDIGEPIDCFVKMSDGSNRDKSICRVEEDSFSIIDEESDHEYVMTTNELISIENSIIGVAMARGTFYTYANEVDIKDNSN